MTETKQSPREKSLKQDTQSLIDQKLWIKILIGMVLGVITGLILSPEGLAVFDKEIALSISEWLALPGVFFLGLISMVIIPLIFCSIVLGIAESGDLSFLKQIGFRLVTYFIFTTAISITIGITIVSIIQPGSYIGDSMVQESITSQSTSIIPDKRFDDLTIPQRIANILPTNPAKAQVERNMLQIVIAAILVGIALISIPQKTGNTFKELCISGQVLSMKIIDWAMAIAPHAVFGLLASVTVKIGLDALIGVGAYVLSVMLGLGCVLLFYLAIVAFISSRSVFEYLKNIKEVQLLAFSTSSSAATMPFSIAAAEEKLKIRPEVSRFTVPLGATINMDGTALYQAVAALFLCQVFGIELSMSETILLLITTVGASIGTPATPGVGLVVLATILSSLGVPAEGIALIIGVDRLLDMCRTAVNVTGDLTACVVMNKIVPKL